LLVGVKRSDFLAALFHGFGVFEVEQLRFLCKVRQTKPLYCNHCKLAEKTYINEQALNFAV
jgi:hypothetical protein